VSVSAQNRATLDSSERTLNHWYPESVFGGFTDVDRTTCLWQLSRALSRHGFSRHHVWGRDAEPAYLGLSPILYRLGVWHQRYAPRRFATTLIAFAQRDGD